MATCETTRQFLIDYIDGRLGGQILSGVESHLSECEPCRIEVQSLRASWKMLGKYPTIEPSPFFLEGLRRKMHPAGSRLLRILAPFAAAAAVLLIVLAVSTMKSTPGPDETEQALTQVEPADRDLLLDLAQNGNWEIAEDAEFMKAFEVVHGKVADGGEQD